LRKASLSISRKIINRLPSIFAVVAPLVEIGAEEAFPRERKALRRWKSLSKFSILHGRGSGDEPLAFVNVELHCAFIPHFQQKRLARFLIRDIRALHYLEDLLRLFAQCT
jgi:hypothetical protein